MWQREHLVCSWTDLGTGRELLISFEVQTSLKKEVTLAPSLHISQMEKQTKSHNWTLTKRLSQQAQKLHMGTELGGFHFLPRATNQ